MIARNYKTRRQA